MPYKCNDIHSRKIKHIECTNVSLLRKTLFATKKELIEQERNKLYLL